MPNPAAFCAVAPAESSSCNAYDVRSYNAAFDSRKSAFLLSNTISFIDL
jgi:hypothetical protein